MAFDIHTENSVEVHQLSFTDNRFPMYLAILGGRLCFITYREQEWGVRAWIITGYGSKRMQESLFRICDYLMDGVTRVSLSSGDSCTSEPHSTRPNQKVWHPWSRLHVLAISL